MSKKLFPWLAPDEQEKKETGGNPLGPKPGGPGPGKKTNEQDDEFDDILKDVVKRNERVNETDDREGQ